MPDGIIVVVPLLTGVTVKVPPLHMVEVCAGTKGFGSTVTVTVKLLPVQLAVLGVTVYVAVAMALVVFVKVWLIEV